LTSEITTTSNTPFGQLSFAELRAQATAVIQSASLERDKHILLGVPHIITRVTYRPGITDQEGNDKDYVSVEALVADAATLAHEVRRGRIPGVSDIGNLPFEPEEKVVYNDGSTGIRRQITHLLHNMGLIEVPVVEADLAVFDTPYFGWSVITQTGLMNGDDDTKIEVPDFQYSPSGAPLAIVVGRGLRVSEFPNPANPKTQAEVFYLS